MVEFVFDTVNVVVRLGATIIVFEVVIVFWIGGALIAAAAGLAYAAPIPMAGALAGALGLIGLFAYEHAHVQAAQSVPLA